MLATLRQYLRYTSWPIIAAMVGLMGFGIAAIHVSEGAQAVGGGFTMRQIVYACIAMGAFVAATVIPYRKLGQAAYVLFGLTMAALVIVLLPKVFPSVFRGWTGSFLPERRGSYRWIQLGPVQVQPSEVAKITFIVLLAWYLRFGDRYRRLRGLIVPFVLTLVPMALILMEPDLGTSLLLLPTLYVMLFMAGARLRHLAGIVAVGTVLVLLPVPRKVHPSWKPAELATRRSLAYWSFHAAGAEYLVSAAPLTLRIGSKDLMPLHQLQRIDGWLRQGQPLIARGIGYQLHQSKMILGAGRWTGRGDWNTTSTYFRMLPDDHTDFIFSVIGGQWGLLGCLALLGMYGVIFLFGVEIAVITYDPFGRLLAVGVMALLFSQIVINVGMTMGLVPITGMTLPLVSYGGSSLVVNCAALGLLVNVGQRRPILLSRRPFEYGEKQKKPPAPYGPLAETGK